MNFTELDELLGKYELFDISMQKISTYKDRIAKAKGEFDEFKAAVELARMVYPLMEIFKNADNEEDEILLDNQFYCGEASKHFPSIYQKDSAKETQTEFLNFKFFDIQRYMKIFEQNKIEIEKVVEEWHNVYQMHIMKDRMKKEINTEFVLEKYNKKEYLIIKSDNFTTLTELLKKNLDLAQEKLDLFPVPREDIIVVKIFQEFKNIVKEMLDIVKGLKDKQEQLERYMDKTTEIKKKPECFQMLKQAEKQYKIMIDMIAENSNKLQTVYVEKDKYKGYIEDLTKLFKDIEKTLYE